MIQYWCTTCQNEYTDAVKSAYITIEKCDKNCALPPFVNEPFIQPGSCPDCKRNEDEEKQKKAFV
jgi:hypothetical protein